MKLLNILNKFIKYAIISFAIIITACNVISSKTFIEKGGVDFVGYSILMVKSDSMAATDFKSGDLILIKDIEPEELKEGDIISFFSKNKTTYGEIITHKIRTETTDEKGNPGFIVYGTTTGADDRTVVTYDTIIGKYERVIPGLGLFFSVLKTTPGYICFIAIPFIILIFLELINFMKVFNKYKEEQLDEIESEK